MFTDVKTTQHPTAIGKKGLQHVQQSLPPTHIWSHHYCKRPLSSLRVNSQHNKPFHTKYMRQNELYNKLRLLRRFQLNDFSIRFYQHSQKFKLNFMISELTMWVKGLRWFQRDIFLNTWQRDVFTGKQFSLSKQNLSNYNNAKAASLTLKWSIVTKSWKKGRISSILSSSHWFRNSMALKQKNIIKSIKFTNLQPIYWGTILSLVSGSQKMVTKRQNLLQSNYISRGTQIPNPNKLNTNPNWSVEFSWTDLHHHILTFGFATSQGWSGIISEAMYRKVPHAMHTHYLDLASFQQLLSYSSLFMWNFIF